MTAYNADIATNLAAVPPVRTKVNRLNGRLRVFQSTYVVPAGGLAIADTINWGPLPIGARTLGHLAQLSFSAGTASATLTVGDAASAARHLAATSIAAAGTAVPNAANASGAQFETSDASSAATNNCNLISTLAGAGMPAGQVVTLTMPYVTD